MNTTFGRTVPRKYTVITKGNEILFFLMHSLKKAGIRAQISIKNIKCIKLPTKELTYANVVLPRTNHP